nr:zinc-dependent alcohol dehydrogenase family protein [Streptomyces sp. SID5785]
MRIVDEPPGAPGPGEVRVRIEAFAVNRLDELTRSGRSPASVRLPRARLGCEGAGTVEVVGEGVSQFEAGDAVIVTAVPDMTAAGTYADHAVFPATRLIRAPEALSPTRAAALWVAYSTAYGALVEKAGMQPGDRVLITAASGTVGLAALQIARQVGAVPIAVTRHEAKRDALLAAGAAAVIATDTEDLVEAARRHTGGAGADIVIDSVMGPGLAQLAQAAKRFTGTLVTVGWLDPRPAPYPSAPVTTHRYMSFEHTLNPEAVRRIAAFLYAGLRTGALSPAVDRVFPLDAVADAHRYLAAGQESPGKIVVSTQAGA